MKRKIWVMCLVFILFGIHFSFSEETYNLELKEGQFAYITRQIKMTLQEINQPEEKVILEIKTPYYPFLLELKKGETKAGPIPNWQIPITFLGLCTDEKEITAKFYIKLYKGPLHPPQFTVSLPFNVPIGVKPANGEINLYWNFFKNKLDYNQTLIVVGENAAETDVLSALWTKSIIHVTEVVTDDEISENDKKTKNLILIGGPGPGVDKINPANKVAYELVEKGITTVEFWRGGKGSDDSYYYFEDAFSSGRDVILIAGKDRETTVEATKKFIQDFLNKNVNCGINEVVEKASVIEDPKDDVDGDNIGYIDIIEARMKQKDKRSLEITIKVRENMPENKKVFFEILFDKDNDIETGMRHVPNLIGADYKVVICNYYYFEINNKKVKYLVIDFSQGYSSSMTYEEDAVVFHGGYWTEEIPENCVTIKDNIITLTLPLELIEFSKGFRWQVTSFDSESRSKDVAPNEGKIIFG